MCRHRGDSAMARGLLVLCFLMIGGGGGAGRRAGGERLSRRADLARAARPTSRRARRRYWCRSAGPSRTARRWRSASTMFGCMCWPAKIARALGNALVAPVIAYVPEGDVDRPEGHLKFPGTITVPVGAFEQDPRICGEELQARRLPRHRLFGRPWRLSKGRRGGGASGSTGNGRRPRSAPMRSTEYYRASETEFGQLLKSKGYSEAEIGTHAGLLDTSLMMATDPSLVRTDLLGETKPGDGTHGDPRRVERRARPARRRPDRRANRRRDQRRPSPTAESAAPHGDHLLPHFCWRLSCTSRSAAGSASPCGSSRLLGARRLEFADCRSGPPAAPRTASSVVLGRRGIRARGAIRRGPGGRRRARCPSPAAGQRRRPPHPSRPASIETVPGMPPVLNPANLYSAAGANMLSPAVAGALPRVYVPNLRSNDVYVIDPATRKVVDRFPVGFLPQHVVPSWDLQTLWVANNGRRRSDGSLTPIDPKTGKPGAAHSGRRPLQHVFHAGRQGRDRRRRAAEAARFSRSAHDGAAAIGADARAAPASTTPISRSTGATRSSPASSAAAGWSRSTWSTARCVGYLKLDARGMPQDIRISPDGKVFFVADMLADGV